MVDETKPGIPRLCAVGRGRTGRLCTQIIGTCQNFYLGYEGTLGIILEAVVKPTPAAKIKTWSLVHYNDRIESIAHGQTWSSLGTRSSGWNVIDYHVLSNSKLNDYCKRYYESWFRVIRKPWWMVEFMEIPKQKLMTRQKARKQLKSVPSGLCYPVTADKKKITMTPSPRKTDLGLHHGQTGNWNHCLHWRCSYTPGSILPTTSAWVEVGVWEYGSGNRFQRLTLRV